MKQLVLSSRIAVALLLMGIMTGANAAGLSLIPTSNIDGVSSGDIVSFDILMDISDYPNGALGGAFDIVFDPGVMQFVSFFRDPAVGDPMFSRDPDILNGLLESWGVAALEGLPSVAILGNVEFTVLPTLGNGNTLVSTDHTTDGYWIDAVTFVDKIPMIYGGAEVSGVPVPAAVWFLLSGLITLVGIRGNPGCNRYSQPHSRT